VARADSYSYYYYSLEWLVDASDSIVEATLVPSDYKGNPSLSTATVQSVDRVLKSIEKAGPCKGDVLPTHIAGVKKGGSHKVLLFMRPVPKKANEREVLYCIYLNEADTEEDKKVDPLNVLPWHSSSWERLEFSWPACVAINSSGKTMTDPKAVLKIVEERIKADPKRLTNEGEYRKCSPLKDDGHDHNLLVPTRYK
jgi:hypothetical protein